MAVRVSAAAAANLTPSACADAVERAGTLNAEALFVGSVICSRVSREEDTSFLMLAAQVRGSTDMREAVRGLSPGDAAVPFGAVDLWGFIYMYGGGFGAPEMLRDRNRAEALFIRLREFRPTRLAGYNPGWDTPNHLSDAEYRTHSSEIAEARIAQLSRLSTLFQDDEYWALEQERDRLSAEHRGQFEIGTPPHARIEAIRAEQQAIEVRMGLAEPSGASPTSD